MVYVALLRGVNVGGNNIVSMKALKESFERLSLLDVTTYINSGNVLFRARATDAPALEGRIDRMLSRAHELTGRTVVRTYPEMARLVKTISETWQPDPAWKYNVIFLRRSVDPERLLAEVPIKPDIEQVVRCGGTLLWSARINALGRTAMLKLVSRPVYRDMTVRNLNTTRKIAELMERMTAARGARRSRTLTSAHPS